MEEVKKELRQLQNSVDDWIKRYGVRYFDVMTNMACLTEEVGEVAHVLARQFGEQSFKTEEKAKAWKRELGDELCDALWVLVCIANQTGIDLTEAFESNVEKKTHRDEKRHLENKKLNS